MPTIKKIVLSNFKKFNHLAMDFEPDTNILVGDNETGKSSILLAIDLVLSGSRSKAESIGLEALLHRPAIEEFLAGSRTIAALPELLVEIYLSDGTNPDLNGKNNSLGIECDGLKMKFSPIREFSREIQESLKDNTTSFPFEYYAAQFFTFAEDSFSGYKKYARHILIDSARIDNEYAAREYTRSVFEMHTDSATRYKLENSYRQGKAAFRESHLTDLNSKLDLYQFDVRTSSRSNLGADLVITEESIPIDGKGRGRQCVIKTEFALEKASGEAGIDVLLLEEPENHLSHTIMMQLVERIAESSGRQLFIATHSSLIASRLDLRKAVLLGVNGKVTTLKALPEDTARFFMKAPNKNVLEFALSSKVILVEGDAEYILLEALYAKHARGGTLSADRVHVISVGGTSFKRYLDLAKVLGVRTAVIRDNDGKYQQNCVENYADHTADSIKVFADTDDSRHTFEVCLYQDNKIHCDDLFSTGRRKLSPLEYILTNKTDAAFELLDKKAQDLTAPGYIQEAIQWVRA